MADTGSPSVTTALRPYKGSCHCGRVKYIVHLSFPPSLDPDAKAPVGTRIRKCNCSTCHKLSFFHVRPQHPPRDFVLLSPSKPEDCSVYRCFEGSIRWCFCGTCSAMTFAHSADGGIEGETVEVNVDGKTQTAWRPKEEWSDGQRWVEGKTAYLSVNAATLDQDQEGLDLREWHENGWINYLDLKDGVDDNHFGWPSKGGMY